MKTDQYHDRGDPRSTPNNVLILGSTGMVGRSWVELLQKKQIKHKAVSRPEFDLMDPKSIAKTVSDDFDLVVNAAAWTDVDGAESDETGATRANGHALGELAERCKLHDSLLISYSTDYVFAGDGSSPYQVDTPTAPINAYGRSKQLGEQLLSQSDTAHILIRTSWIYAPWGKNFVRTIWNLAKSRDELQVVNDQRGRPTSAQHLASNSLELYLNGALGTWHLCDDGECTWFDFAKHIAQIANPRCKVNPCSSDQYPRPAKRPAYSTLDLSLTTDLINGVRNWDLNLNHVCKLIADSDTCETSA